ncbi:MAG: pyruvate:ferredoxin (flavodoxin) oxidoreductase [Propionibacteriaceae bacterium]|nr:pyruvate:ferredoxin (flavodoxin) oxidoreductase [Micropruina sp.]HBY23204.1 pyruvate:ferredoxin (flavodoxin) oxidoreductase [Propionibacteriaceae bacterium]
MAQWATIEGNEAAARVAHALSEVIAIYPITPSSPMGELSDTWTSQGRPNIWGCVPEVVEMQSEGGAAGALHGIVSKGVLGTTFTASQGLLLMMPNMYKIAGELTPTVIHVAARTIATHSLSIFGDHSDVMGARMTGFAMLCSASVQEAQDFALVAHAATLRTRVPFLHFFDGFRTSHEVNTIELLSADDLRALIREEDVLAFRARGMTPDAPDLRGTAENPDTFFQAREASNPFHAAVPAVVAECFAELAERTGRDYHLVDYVGAPDAERVIVIMGSGAGAVEETVAELNARGEKVGAVFVRLYRPFPADEFRAALPASVRSIAVLDRTKEPGALAEPLHLDVVMALAGSSTRIIGGRYGLSSKEFTPGMVAAAFTELAKPEPKPRFTVGITDDVTHLSLSVDPDFRVPSPFLSAVFFGLGSDGTVGAAKNSVKIIGEQPDADAQGYFVYDSRKAGASTVSHLRFGQGTIKSTYLITEADFVAVHFFDLLRTMPTLDLAKPGATVLLNAPCPPEQVWDRLPVEVQAIVLEKQLKLYSIQADLVAREAGLGKRINTVMQPCFFYLSGVVPQDQAITKIKEAVEKTYGKRGRLIVERNFAAIDAAIGALHEVPIPGRGEANHSHPHSGPGAAHGIHRMPPLPTAAPDFVQRVTAKMLHGHGDLLPVSALPVDGVWPSGTSKWEKRGLATEIPIWDASLCIDCGKCAVVCPHAAIRIKVTPNATLEAAPEGFKSKKYADRSLKDHQLIVQVAPDDCTGCGICVDICPARSRTEAKHKSIDMLPAAEHRDAERKNFDFFMEIPEIDRTLVRHDQVKGVAQLEPLFEFSLACSGCGETPYIKTLTQLFGDRMLVANATGCSSIFGGNLPTAPYTTNADGRGPAWSNSLFEDNAEFGLGIRMAWENQNAEAKRYLTTLRPWLDADLVEGLLTADQTDEAGIIAQRARVTALKAVLAQATADHPDLASVRSLESLADELVEKSVWIIGGDGWAYDIGYGGLDHVLASGRNVNILVLDTEVYSNTGGQASKATPRGASAKFAVAGKGTQKKDLGMIAQAYGNVYVAQLAIGANQQQTVRAMLEAQAWDGPSILIAYSTCIAHGIEMSTSMTHQIDAVSSGYWPLFRVRPNEHVPFALDSKAPNKPVKEFMAAETRFSMLTRSNPERAELLGELAQADADERWRYYSQVAGIERDLPDLVVEDENNTKENS